MIDKQTLEFAARVLQNLPPLSSEVMQDWVDAPVGLKRALWALCRFKTFMTIKLGTSPRRCGSEQ